MLLVDTWLLFDYWKMEPPSHVLSAWELQYKPPRKGAISSEDFNNASMALGGKVKKKSQLPPELQRQLDRIDESPQVKKLMAEMFDKAGKA